MMISEVQLSVLCYIQDDPNSSPGKLAPKLWDFYYGSPSKRFGYTMKAGVILSSVIKDGYAMRLSGQIILTKKGVDTLKLARKYKEKDTPSLTANGSNA